MNSNLNNNETIVLAGGCFWCVEAVFKMIKGVKEVMPGYAGGYTGLWPRKPTYERVARGNSGYAEVIKIEYDPKEISLNDLLTVFFASHDPTTLNRQGNDIGSQYRSAIFYTTDEQKKQAEKFINDLINDCSLDVVTEVAPLDKFFPAEDYHKDYYEKNKNAGYCQLIINPKLEKIKSKFRLLLKKRGIA